MDISWNNLPSVVLLEVFSYLSHDDKIRASSSCKHWRCTLYHPSYWQTIHFIATPDDPDSFLRTRFLTSCFAKKLRNATITFESLDFLAVEEVSRILQRLSENMYLRRLILEPSDCGLNCGLSDVEHEEKNYIGRYLLKPLQLIARQCRSLQALSLGGSEELTLYAKPVLDLLHEHQSCSLQHLGIATLKKNPDNYLLLELDSTYFRSFPHLQVLTIDYDYVCDSLLGSLGNSKLLRLIIHVHGVEDSHPGTTNSAWATLTHLNPHCELRLNLIHSYDSIGFLDTDILQPAMPLTHFKALFCLDVNITALHLLSSWYSSHLRSLWLVDALDSIDSNSSPRLITDPHEEDPDPLVMAAWRCKNLEEIVLLGYKYSANDVVAIARLRGSGLKRLDVYLEDIDHPDAEQYCSDNLELEVSRNLGRPWTALTEWELHRAVRWSSNVSDPYVLPITLLDHNV